MVGHRKGTSQAHKGHAGSTSRGVHGARQQVTGALSRHIKDTQETHRMHTSTQRRHIASNQKLSVGRPKGGGGGPRPCNNGYWPLREEIWRPQSDWRSTGRGQKRC